MGLMMRKVEAGVYETLDARYRVERVDSFGEWDATTSTWVITTNPGHPNVEWPEVGVERLTKRECVEALERILALESPA